MSTNHRYKLRIKSNKKKRKTSEISEVVFEYTGREEQKDIPKDVTIVRFDSSAEEVGESMFKGCEQLKKVVLNEGLKKIGFRSFYYCNKLVHLNLTSTLLKISERAFYNCVNLREVVFNEGLQTIGDYAFYNCKLLESIRLPSTVTEIGDSAFYKCDNLRGVVLNETLQTIRISAFAHCTSLEGIIIPHTVTEISHNTFYNCRNMRVVGLHEGIKKIGLHAFEGWSSLERFTFPTLSSRLWTITLAGQTEVENKIDHIPGLVRRGSELFIPTSIPLFGIIRYGGNWKIVKEVLGRIDQLLTYYELREATTLLELAMWKSKIDQVEVKHIHRDVYRIDIPGPVKDAILQYLNFRVTSCIGSV